MQGLAEELARRGVDMTVVTRRFPGTAPDERLGGVRVVRIPMFDIGRFHLPRGYLRTLRSLSADVFHLSGNRVWCADYYLPRIRQFPWAQVMTGHGFYQYEMHRRAWDRWYFERYLPRRIALLDCYTAITSHEREQLVSWGVEPAQIEIVPNGIDLEEFRGPRSDPETVRLRWGLKTPRVLVYVGGFYENKRVDRLVRAVAATRGEWGLVAAGRDLPGTRFDRAAISALATQLGAPVALYDVLPRSEVLDALNAADAVGVGSSYEGFGLLLLEAMATGRPFVAFRTGAAPELASTGSGFCVDTEPEFADALRRLSDPIVRQTMGARGREMVGAYTVVKQADRFLEVYGRAVERRRSRSSSARSSIASASQAPPEARARPPREEVGGSGSPGASGSSGPTVKLSGGHD